MCINVKLLMFNESTKLRPEGKMKSKIRVTSSGKIPNKTILGGKTLVSEE